MAVLAGRLDPAHALDVDDVRTVDAHEAPRIEQHLEFGQALVLQPRLATRADAHVIVLRLDDVDIKGCHHVHLRAVADQHPFERPAAGGGLPQHGVHGRRRGGSGACARVRQRDVEPLLAERLEQVIDRVHLERLDGVLLEGGDEDDSRGQCRARQFQHFKPVQLRHLDVEEHQVGPQFGDRLDRFEAVGAFADNVDVGMKAEVFAQYPARKLFVVDDDHPHAAPPFVSKGSVSSTRNRLPLFDQWIAACSP